MYYQSRLLERYRLEATDGEVGKIHDFYFDDHEWVVRYLIVDVGDWLPGRKVLIDPRQTGQPDHERKTIPIELSREKIEDAPTIAEHEPVSKQHQIDLHKYHAWPVWWGASSISEPAPFIPSFRKQEYGAQPAGEPPEEPALRSINEVHGYHIEAMDGSIGHVEDFLLEENSFRVGYLVIDTRNWLPGKKVLVAPEWIRRVDWYEAKVHFDLEREQIKTSPEYESSQAITQDFEDVLRDWYATSKYSENL